MTTASVYYHPGRDRDPAFVLIDGDREYVHAADYGTVPDLPGARIRAIDHACRRLGWKVIDGAAIVRKIDGTATIRIEPTPGQPTADPAVARIAVNDATIPQTVTVDGKTEPVHTLCALTSSMPRNNERARDAVRTSLRAIGYRAVGQIGYTETDEWAVTVEVDGPAPVTAYITRDDTGRTGTLTVDGRNAKLSNELLADGDVFTAVDATLTALGYERTGEIVASTVADFECEALQTGTPAEPADWRDHPTIVRVDDTAARLLNQMSDTLGIPADVLATEWIGRAAADAHAKHRQAVGPGGWLADHTRIKGWMVGGTPYLDEPGPPDGWGGWWRRLADETEG